MGGGIRPDGEKGQGERGERFAWDLTIGSASFSCFNPVHDLEGVRIPGGISLTPTLLIRL